MISNTKQLLTFLTPSLANSSGSKLASLTHNAASQPEVSYTKLEMIYSYMLAIV